MDHYSGTDILNTWLKAWPSHSLDLYKLLAFFIRDVVPSAMKRHWHASVLSLPKRCIGYQNIGVYVLDVSVFLACTLLHQIEVERVLIECSLESQG